MGKYKRYKNSIEKFLSSDKGQRFFNFAYSIGAAIVIWGALFKILHLPGGSLLLSIGMGTEVLMFILSAFDTPPKTYHWEEVFPVLNSKNPEDRPEFSGGKGTVIIGGNGKGGGSNITENSEGISDTSQGYVSGMETLNRNISGLNTIYEIQLKSISSQLDNIDRVNNGLKNIRDMYERSASDSSRYCEATEKMTQYIQQLNSVYEKMITAMTINMYRPMGGAPVEMPEKQKDDTEQK